MNHDDLLLNLQRTSIDVPVSDILRGFDGEEERERISTLMEYDVHERIIAAAEYLLEGGYEALLSRCEFWDEPYRRFSGHCHQMTPALGAVLSLLDIPVRYKEAYRIENHFMRSGFISKMDPKHEPNPEHVQEFCALGRIPYCALQVETPDGKKLISPKHLALSAARLEAKLTPFCYELKGTSLAHQTEPLHSGIYLEQWKPLHLRENVDLEVFPVWTKQKMQDGKAAEPVEWFATYKDIGLLLK